MSAEEFDAGLALRAYVDGQAISCSSRRRISLHGNATLVALRTMAGVEGSLWGVAVGRAGDARPVVVVASDPVVGIEQAECFRAIGAETAVTPHPCLVVANPEAADALFAAALRARRTADPVVARGVEIARFVAERGEVAGSDSLVVATTALAEHFVWPGRDLEPGSLSRALSCLTGRPEAVDRDSSGSTTTPLELDLRRLDAVVSRSRRERERVGEVGLDAAKRRRVEVGAVLAPLLRADFALLAEAAGVLELPGLELLSGAERRCAAETRAWSRAEDRIARGIRRSARPSALGAALHLRECEHARARLEMELLAEDSIARARAVASGSILSGTITAIDGPLVALSTAQVVLRQRTGDSVVLQDLGLSAEVVAIAARAGSTTVRLRLAGPLPDGVGLGATIETTPVVLDVPARQKGPSWTHDRPAGPASEPATEPGGDPARSASA
jgi:hypothetical protein